MYRCCVNKYTIVFNLLYFRYDLRQLSPISCDDFVANFTIIFS